MRSALKQRVVQQENINPAVNQQRAINGEGLLQVMSGVVDISSLRAVVEDADKENLPPSFSFQDNGTTALNNNNNSQNNKENKAEQQSPTNSEGISPPSEFLVIKSGPQKVRVRRLHR